MKNAFYAVAFDIDGTLYPNYRFYAQLIPFLLRRWRLLLAFARARKVLRRLNKEAQDFYNMQAELMALYLSINAKPGTAGFLKKVEKVQSLTEKEIYTRWEGLFKKVKLFPDVVETVKAFRNAGLKTAVLSDFPLRGKLKNLGIDGLWDVELCSEELGALKPAKVSFMELQKRLDIPAEHILFVGNSVRCDIAGAKSYGMKAALIHGGIFPPPKADPPPDLIFSAYRQLHNFVLQ
ncbi:MAG: HAD family hydrolase [Spirochaetaceae bacterium]|jgi:putative hydrolase of the HAD superfamily|nr:HAD family hydrolase [Spirochaetaceae bacterium]